MGHGPIGWVLAGALLSAALPGCTPATDGGRRTVDFDRGWRFHFGDVHGAEAPGFDDSAWRLLDLPHDWSIEAAFDEHAPAGVGGGALPGGVGWYRRTFVSPADSNHVVFIDFDGVYENSEVWINGHRLGRRPYGYSSFRYELTPHLRSGADATNVVAVRVDNSRQPNSRWYSGSGIYRHVRLVVTDPVHVDHWGTHVTTPDVGERHARIVVRTTVRNAGRATRQITLITTLVDSTAAHVATTSSDHRIGDDTTLEVPHELTVADPVLWSVDRPYLYRVLTRIECDGSVCDDYETPLGIRTFGFDADLGFSLNGHPLELRGVCLHHDLGALGAAVNTRALERQLEIMKAMGANAIRTAHNPPAPELLELTDRMGFVVMDEAFDVWSRRKTEFDYHLYWDEWHRRDLEDLVRRDRNHPSVFIWSIGNEVIEQWGGDTAGAAIARELADIVRALDPTRPVTAGLNNTDLASNTILQAGVLDLVGFNYGHHVWPDVPKLFPGQPFIATETTSSVNTRGHYDQPSDSVAFYDGPWAEDQGPPPNPSHRLSAYDHRRTGWGSLHEDALRTVEANDHIGGMFVWTGIDYLGEPTPYGWPARSSYFGIVDLAGFPKDVFHLYRSVWTDEPVLHVFPHWNWTAGDTIDVWAYTNAEEVELFLNGSSLGTRRRTEPVQHLMWRVPYEPGELRAEGRTRDRTIATAAVRTSEDPARVVLEPDRATIAADGTDLSFVTVTVEDRNGIGVPDANLLIRLAVDGAARIAAVDNGDQISHAPFRADSVRLFNGRALVVLQAGDSAGTVTLQAFSDGLEPATTTIRLRSPDSRP